MAKKSKKPNAGKAKAAQRRAAKPVKRSGKSKKQLPAKAGKAKKQSTAKAGKAAGGAGIVGLWDRAAQFLREVVQEFKRVTWPSRKQTISTTGVVIVLVILVSVFLGMVDFVLSRLIRLLIS